MSKHKKQNHKEWLNDFLTRKGVNKNSLSNHWLEQPSNPYEKELAMKAENAWRQKRYRDRNGRAAINISKKTYDALGKLAKEMNTTKEGVIVSLLENKNITTTTKPRVESYISKMATIEPPKQIETKKEHPSMHSGQTPAGRLFAQGAKARQERQEHEHESTSKTNADHAQTTN